MLGKIRESFGNGKGEIFQGKGNKQSQKLGRAKYVPRSESRSTWQHEGMRPQMRLPRSDPAGPRRPY